MKISWELPEFRPGIWGRIDRFIGPGATKAEQNIQFFPPLALGFGIVAFGLYAQTGWTISQYLIAAFLAVDMLGGVLTNATSAAKRWYFRNGQGFEDHITFVSLHLVQIVLFSWAFLELNLIWVAGVYSVLMFGSILILWTPLYLQRPVAAAVYVISLFLSLYVFETEIYLEWFLPVFFFKILISHVLREEPYRPE